MSILSQGQRHHQCVEELCQKSDELLKTYNIHEVRKAMQHTLGLLERELKDSIKRGADHD